MDNIDIFICKTVRGNIFKVTSVSECLPGVDQTEYTTIKTKGSIEHGDSNYASVRELLECQE
jgi:hypothetical protein